MNRSSSVNRPGVTPEATGDAAAFRAIAEVSGDVAFIVDCNSHALRYLSPSARLLLGDAGADAAGGEEFPPALVEGLGERLRLFAAGDEGQRQAVRDIDLAKPDGQTVPVRIITTLVVDAAGKVVSLAGILRDQSQQREREAQQKRFASMLNHEFRTPLATIDGAIQRLEATGAAADAPTRQRYRKIAVAVDRLIAMLDEYLSPDRMSSLGGTCPPNAVAPRQLLEEAAAQARAAGREALLALDELPPSLRCDPAGLRLAVKVLVDNALAFSPAGSPIELAGRTVANGIELSVRDHGGGVPPQDAACIFDKAYRGSNAAGLPGNGLGLYMARSVLEVHGGAVELVSPPGKGALFKIILPMKIYSRKYVATGEASSDNPLRQAGVDARQAPQP
jgi:signal transduction histidine kinase